jgi:AcrR family transcriptional regulator
MPDSRGRARERRRSNAEWTQATSTALLRHARIEFARRGYAAASLERIAEHAKVTKGAIYYHFGSKEGLFEAVFRQVEREMTDRIHAAAIASINPVDAIVDGCISFLQTAVDDSLRQIALVDGPVVLGWSRWRAIDAEFGLGSLKEGLRGCHHAGLLSDLDLDLMAHLISGAVNEGVFVIAEATDRDAAFNVVSRTVGTLVRRVLDHNSSSRRTGTAKTR